MDTSIESFLMRKSILTNTPIKGTLEVSPVCNMHCKMCYISQQGHEVAEKIKPVDYWLQLIPQFKEAGVLFLTLIGGEPFLYPGIEKLYETLYETGFYVSLTSNGTLLTNGIPDWLEKRKPRYITISLYGASDETYRLVTGNPHGFTQVMETLRLLKNADIPVNLNYCALPENYMDTEKILQFAKGNDYSITPSFYCFPSNSRRASSPYERLKPEIAAEVFWMIQRIISSQSYEKILKYYATDKYLGEMIIDEKDFSCYSGTCSFWVNWEGKIAPCGLIKDISEELNAYNFSDAWKKIVLQVKEITTSVQCKHCNKKKICEVCPAMMMAETGSFQKTPQYICDITEEKIRYAKRIMNIS